MRRAALALLWLVAGAPGAGAAACAPDRADLVWSGGSAGFQVERAATPAERARGLMLRDHLDPGRGMIFVYDRPQEVAFWMKDTLIPLDMLFIDRTGRVVRIAPDRKPLDETPVPSGGAVMFVLEIAGGEAARRGIGMGAVLQSPLVPQAQAALPCPAP